MQNNELSDRLDKQNINLSDRLEKLEGSVSDLKDQQYKYHLELLEKIQGFHNHCNDEVNEVKRTLEKHSSYWAMLISCFGLVGAGIVAWIQGIFGKH